MRMLFKLNERGFTLIEIIVTLVLTVTVMGAIGTFFVRNLQYNNMAQDEVYIQDQVRNAVKGLTNLVMEKKTVDLTSTGAKFNVGLEGEMEIEYDDSTKEVKFITGSNERVLARDITKFKIANSGNLITVTIEGSKRKATFQAVEKIYLRNRV